MLLLNNSDCCLRYMNGGSVGLGGVGGLSDVIGSVSDNELKFRFS